MDFNDYPTVWLPKGAQIIHIDEQNNSIRESRMLYLWAVVDVDEKENVERKFRLAGTGHELGDDLEHITTIQTSDGTLVWHIFEIIRVI